MQTEVLRSEKGGYVKADVLQKLDRMNALLMAARGGMRREEAMAELESIRETELRREKAGLFGKIGFSVEDTDAYLESVGQMILEAVY
ncbi:MAG: hypothetical protein IKH75_00010 [Ruminococcus sp.]|nr:hypothetical protein [Ruminococcus sp.]